MDIDPQTVKQTAPGLLGAVGAMMFIKGPILIRVAMIVPGGAMAFYGSDWISKQTGMPEGLAGFVIGLVGMVFVGKIITTWQDFDLGTILRHWLRKRLGLQGGEE